MSVDSDSGHVDTYVTTDVVNFIRRNLNVDPRRMQWAIGGYSNGGECALSFGAKRPDLFGSILDISGELEPLSGTEANTIGTIFKGNKRHSPRRNRPTSSKDTGTPTSSPSSPAAPPILYTPRRPQQRAADAAAPGMTTRRFVGPGIGHRADALGDRLSVPPISSTWCDLPPGLCHQGSWAVRAPVAWQMISAPPCGDRRPTAGSTPANRDAPVVEPQSGALSESLACLAGGEGLLQAGEGPHRKGRRRWQQHHAVTQPQQATRAFGGSQLARA